MLSSTMEQDALTNLQVGLVAARPPADIDEVADRLAGARPGGRSATVTYASNLGKIGLTELALRYLQLAADHGLTDVERVIVRPESRRHAGSAGLCGHP